MPGSEPWLQTVPRAASQPSSCANRVLWLATGRPESAPEVMQIATYRGSCGAHLRYSGKKSVTIRRSSSKGGDVEKTMKLSQGEKLILLMLCEIQEHLKIEGGTNTKLIQ